MSALTVDGVLQFLREKLGVAHLIMSGITTSGPVLGTAMNATGLEFVVTVVGDGFTRHRQLSSTLEVVEIQQ